MTRRLWALLTRCPCRRLPYLDHHRRNLHVRNEADLPNYLDSFPVPTAVPTAGTAATPEDFDG